MMTSRFAAYVARLLSVAAVAMPLVLHAPPASASLDPAPAAAPHAAAPAAAARYVMPLHILDGNPAMGPGQDMGYWVWRDRDGIHLRTTTRGREHNFNGVIRASDGSTLANVNRVQLEHQGSNDDRVEVADDHQSVRFHFDTWDGQDGFDFRLNGRAFCMELENNGHEALDATHLGGAQVKPEQLPVCFVREANR